MAPEEYTADWFSSYIPTWIEWLGKFRGKANLQFLEIGAYEGMATCWLLDNILTDDKSRIIVIDTFEGSMEHRERGEYQLDALYDRFMRNIANHRAKVSVMRGRSQWILRTISDPFDFVYVDGSHVASDVLEDAVLSFRLLKLGGRLVFDDYVWNYYDDPHLNPRLGIDAFLNCFHNDYNLIVPSIPTPNQVCIEKTRD